MAIVSATSYSEQVQSHCDVVGPYGSRSKADLPGYDRPPRPGAAASAPRLWRCSRCSCSAASYGASPAHPRRRPSGSRISAYPPLARKPAKQLAAARKALFATIASDRKAKPGAPIKSADAISGAYFAPWRSTSIIGFKTHAAQLTHVYPAWLSLNPDGKGINNDFWRPDRQSSTKDLVQIARTNGVRIVPVISNAQSGVFDKERVKAMLADPSASARHHPGPGHLRARQWLPGPADRLRAVGRARLSGAASLAGRSGQAPSRHRRRTLRHHRDRHGSLATAKLLASAVDYAVLMAYDEHYVSSDPGPVASVAYTEEMLKRFSAVIPP